MLGCGNPRRWAMSVSLPPLRSGALVRGCSRCASCASSLSGCMLHVRSSIATSPSCCPPCSARPSTKRRCYWRVHALRAHCLVLLAPWCLRGFHRLHAGAGVLSSARPRACPQAALASPVSALPRRQCSASLSCARRSDERSIGCRCVFPAISRRLVTNVQRRRPHAGA